MLISTVTFADENCVTKAEATSIEEQLEIKTDVPKHLKGAVICVVKEDHKMSCVPAEKFKVVPRRQQFIVTKLKQLDKITCSAELNKNRIAVLAGHGAKEGLESSSNSSSVSVQSRVGQVNGIQYQRLITDKLSIGVQKQNNETTSAIIGLDF
jgi:hypothetical protein